MEIIKVITPSIDYGIKKITTKTNSPSNNPTNNPTYSELLKAAKKLRIKGKDEKETIENLLSCSDTFKKIGKGSEGEVYKIPHSNLAIKITDKSQKFLMPDFNPNTQNEINGIVARDARGHYQILRYIKGLNTDKVNASQKEIFDTIVQNMSQDAYDDFLEKTATIHSNGLFYDTCGANMIIDIKNQTFNPIDMRNNERCSCYEISSENAGSIRFNPIESMYYSIYSNTDAKDYTIFLAKAAKSVIKDCKLFPSFIYEYKAGSGIPILNKDNTDKLAQYNKIAELYKNIQKLHERKMELYKQGCTTEEIYEKSKEEIDEYINYVNLNFSIKKDLPKRKLLRKEKAIEKNNESKSSTVRKILTGLQIGYNEIKTKIKKYY